MYGTSSQEKSSLRGWNRLVYFIRFVEICETLETKNEIVQTEKIYAIGVRGEIDDRK